MATANREVYNRQEVAAHYAELNYLTYCEQLLFDIYIKPGSAVLDLGVGGGRTTPYLSSRASRYVGIDYASEMIRACRQKFPGLEFLVAEASHLPDLASCSFDAIVCAFNGLDYVIPDDARARCLEECHRVLKPKGVLIFSSHNPRSIFVRPVWNRALARRFADGLGGPGHLSRAIVFCLVGSAAAMRALLLATWASARRIIHRTPSRAFWAGEGYLVDPVHGGLITHYGTPTRVISELEQREFCILRVLGNDYPSSSGRYTTDWYYYVFSKLDSAGSGDVCA